MRNRGTVQFYERASAPRTDIMNRTRNQLLASACFSLDENCGIGRRDAFDLFQHHFKRLTPTNELLESARTAVPITRPQLLESSLVRCHKVPPSGRMHFPSGINSPELLEHSRAELHRRTAWTGTPPRLLSTPANAFFRPHVP